MRPDSHSIYDELTAKVGVDTSEDTSILSNNVVNSDSSGLSVAAAVSAGSVELAVVVNVKVLDGDGTEAVVLEDLVGSVTSTSTVDVRGSRRSLESGSILTDILPPDVVDNTLTPVSTIPALILVGASETYSCPCSGYPQPG